MPNHPQTPAIQYAIDDLWPICMGIATPRPKQTVAAHGQLVAALHASRTTLRQEFKRLFQKAKAIETYLERLVVFPPPPLVGIPGVIEPLMCHEDLRQEGVTMRHCAGGRINHVFGDAYYYRLLPAQPGLDRATIELKNDHKDTPWRIHEIAGEENASVSLDTVDFVNNWRDAALPQSAPKPGLAYAQVKLVNWRDFFAYEL